MRIIKQLACYLEDEICGSIDYAKDALEYQYERPELSRLFFQMAQVEYSHYETLHEQIFKIINDIKNEGRTYPQKMKNEWEEKHKKLIEKAEEAQMYLNMYK